MEIIRDLVATLQDVGLYALFIAAFIKILTSIAVAIIEKQFNWSIFGEMFTKDLVRLVVVTALVFLYKNDGANALVITSYSAYLAARITANVGAIFPPLGERLPDSFMGRTPPDAPPATPQVGIN